MTDEKNQRANGGKFAPGKSGNPSGRPKSASVELRHQLADHGAEIVGKVIELALAGDPQALKMCLDRIAPAPTHDTELEQRLAALEAGKRVRT